MDTNNLPSSTDVFRLYIEDDDLNPTTWMYGNHFTICNPGCTDITACNYDVNATDDDGTCNYAEDYYDCGGNCITDIDSDGVCDELEIVGCTDSAADNYDVSATDEGMQYPSIVY